MKAHKDIDWELFELLEGDLTPEQEAKIVNAIDENPALESDWEFMQMTQLETPDVTYTHKSKLLKKDTTLIAFSAVQWKRVVGVAAALVLCYPIWNYLIKTTDTTEGMVGAASEVIQPETTVPEATAAVIEEPTSTEDQTSNVAQTIEKPNITIPEEIPNQETNQTNPELNTPIELVSATPTQSNVTISTTITELQALSQVNVGYKMADLIPKDEAKYKGIRATVNTSLALLATPFMDAKIKVQPADNKTMQMLL